MAGLLIALGSEPGWAPRIVRELAPALAHYPWLATRSIDADPFALALVLHHDVEPPVWDVEGAPKVVVFGEYVADDHAPFATHARERRWEALRNRNGLYNLCLWDAQRQRLVLANDASGALLLFSARYAAGWLWCSEPGVLPRAGQLHRVGLRALASIGYQADGGTLDRGVTVLPAATTEVVRLAGGAITSERHSGLPAPDGAMGFFEAHAELVRDAVASRLRGVGPIQVPLTGGLDSRILLAEALGARHEVEAFTLASGDPRDVRLARSVAAVAGVRHVVLPPEPAPLNRHGGLLRTAVYTTADWHPARQLAVCGAGRPGRPILLGFLGGTVAGAFVDRRSATLGVARLRRQALAPYHYGAVPAIAWSQPPAGCERAVPELVENLYGRQRRYTSYLVRLAWNFGRPICPYADVRLLQYALAASRDELADQPARARTLRRRSPQLARIGTPDDVARIGPAVPRLARRAIRRSHITTRWPGFRAGFDFEQLQPLADECCELMGDDVRQRLVALPPMAALALAPVFLDGHGAAALEVCAEP